MQRLLLFCISITTVAAGVAHARDDVAAGRKLALEVCGACHVVSKNQSAPPILDPPAPSFATLARQNKLEEQQLRSFLSKPHGDMGQHGKMPNPQLANYQIDRIVAYLLSLQKNKR